MWRSVERLRWVTEARNQRSRDVTFIERGRDPRRNHQLDIVNLGANIRSDRFTVDKGKSNITILVVAPPLILLIFFICRFFQICKFVWWTCFLFTFLLKVSFHLLLRPVLPNPSVLVPLSDQPKIFPTVVLDRSSRGDRNRSRFLRPSRDVYLVCLLSGQWTDRF